MIARRSVLSVLVAGLVILGLSVPAAQAQRIPTAAPVVYMVNLNGMTGWDVTPEMLVNIFADVDRTFGDLARVSNPGPNEPDQVVQADAWPNHVVVLRLDLGSDPRATHLDPKAQVAKFQRVLEEQLNLRNRRVALWVRRADDAAAFMIPKVPEVFLVPGASSTITDDFAERFSGGNEALVPRAPSLEGMPVCATFKEIVQALGMPETTEVVTGDAQKIIDRWADFRDKAIATAEEAVGEKWDEYERVIEDPDAEQFRKINARRDVENALRRAHTYLIRYADLRKHPAVAPLEAQILERMETLSTTPRPGGPR